MPLGHSSRRPRPVLTEQFCHPWTRHARSVGEGRDGSHVLGGRQGNHAVRTSSDIEGLTEIRLVPELAAAFEAGLKAKIQVFSARGSYSKYTASLTGLTKAYDYIHCPFRQWLEQPILNQGLAGVPVTGTGRRQERLIEVIADRPDLHSRVPIA